MADASHEKRTRILQAARSVCGERGFEAARMEEIAAEAKVSKGTLYRFFPSKEELLLAALLASYTEGERMGRLAAAASPGPRLEALLDGHVVALPYISRQMNSNLQAWGVVGRPGELRERLHEALRRIYALQTDEFRGALEEGMREGRYRKDLDPELCVMSLIALNDGFVYRSTFDPEHANAAVLEAAFADWLRGLRPPSDPSPKEGSDG